ncbi:hypothetical protein GCM10010441_30580 [Kitasatospora paracochleata]|uniref:Uncharacterized protein n=1 Tax=Kitasatospora paracochleata TaxID=58354 RepID=A0ABT1ITA8_9ACTN|nr:hypothetical protein [Kitasatospora paracochleata]MCP2308372.1 hypothetical protein [Kitasatospora paracochleata]
MTVPALFTGLFDDAAVFPPGDAPLPDAVAAHRTHRASWYAESVGPLLCGAGRIGELAALAGPDLPVGLVLPQGSAHLAPALADAAGLTVATVELADPDVRQAVAALDALLPEGVTAAVELPRAGRPEDALDALAGTPYRAKYRTGGLSADAFPDEAELAAFLAGCAERGLPYKCTAGLHHAVRHTDAATGFEHHGFLNVLLASLAGDRKVAADVLAERNGAVLAGAAGELTDPQIAHIRRHFTSFGTCSIAEPLEDLETLGLLGRHLEDR